MATSPDIVDRRSPGYVHYEVNLEGWAERASPTARTCSAPPPSGTLRALDNVVKVAAGSVVSGFIGDSRAWGSTPVSGNGSS